MSNNEKSVVVHVEYEVGASQAIQQLGYEIVNQYNNSTSTHRIFCVQAPSKDKGESNRIRAILTSKTTGRVIEKSFTPRQLLDFFDESALVENMSMCRCQPVGETNVIDCGCYEEWEDYTLVVGDE